MSTTRATNYPPTLALTSARGWWCSSIAAPVGFHPPTTGLATCRSQVHAFPSVQGCPRVQIRFYLDLYLSLFAPLTQVFVLATICLPQYLASPNLCANIREYFFRAYCPSDSPMSLISELRNCRSISLVIAQTQCAPLPLVRQSSIAHLRWSCIECNCIWPWQTLVQVNSCAIAALGCEYIHEVEEDASAFE